MIMLQPHSAGYPALVGGTIADISGRLHLELQMSGYSLLLDDVRDVISTQTLFYAGWATLEAQNRSTVPIALDDSLTLDAYEWGILEPLCRAHCDLLQARRMEGSGSLGGERFGLSISEATQIYDQQRADLPQNALVIEPYSLEMGL